MTSHSHIPRAREPGRLTCWLWCVGILMHLCSDKYLGYNWPAYCRRRRARQLRMQRADPGELDLELITCCVNCTCVARTARTPPTPPYPLLRRLLHQLLQDVDVPCASQQDRPSLVQFGGQDVEDAALGSAGDSSAAGRFHDGRHWVALVQQAQLAGGRGCSGAQSDMRWQWWSGSGNGCANGDHEESGQPLESRAVDVVTSELEFETHVHRVSGNIGRQPHTSTSSSARTGSGGVDEAPAVQQRPVHVGHHGSHVTKRVWFLALRRVGWVACI